MTSHDAWDLADDELQARRRRRAVGLAAAIGFALILVFMLIRPDNSSTDQAATDDSLEVEEPADVEDEVNGVALVPGSGDEVAESAADDTPDDVGGAAAALTWNAGLAATLECNMLAGSDFANGRIPRNWFRDGPELARVDIGGLEGSLTLQVGFADEAGRYAELVPVSAGMSYWFRGWFDPQATEGPPEMGIVLLDAAESQLELVVTAPITATGFVEVVLENVPDGAAFALPYVAKDQSPGVLLADDLVFGTTSTCFEEITALAG